ncbi:MAG TPA: hypothetical protein VF121_08360 [Thermoanaerobaculia bacterium]|nr:hypothetical protein [Thermoanaerobaculia bacterium]
MRWKGSLAAGIAVMLAGAIGCNERYDRDDFDTPTDPARQYLVLTTEGNATTLPADGVSRLRLTAAISPDAAPRDVVFTTTAAQLVGGTGTTDTERTVTVNSSGVAQIDLRSATAPGSAVVTAKVKDLPQISQSVTVSFTAPGPDVLIRFLAAPTSAPADGATGSTFVVEISPQLDSASRSVTFTTTIGSFVSGSSVQTLTVPAASDNTAAAVLYSPTAIGEGRLRATVAGTSREVGIRFERALPDRLILALSKITVMDSAADQLTATATLLRDLGTVTPGTEVVFTATRDDTGASFGFFNPPAAASDANGQAVVSFSPGGGGYTGDATLTARAPNGRTASVAFKVIPAP